MKLFKPLVGGASTRDVREVNPGRNDLGFKDGDDVWVEGAEAESR